MLGSGDTRMDALRAMIIPKLVCTIIDREQTGDLIEIYQEKHVHHNYIINASGTASSELSQAFGLSGTEKTVSICMVPDFKASHILTSVSERLELTRPGNGIVFISPISGVSAVIAHIFERKFEKHHERFEKAMSLEDDKIRESGYELILAMVNFGYSDSVMEAARAHGAKGGTIIHARRTGDYEERRFFGITLQDEKEIIAILARKDQRREIMQTISIVGGIKTEARGLVFSIPVEDIVGLDAEADE